MAAPSTLDPWREKGIPVDKQYRSWRQIVKEPVNKLEVDAYSCYARLPVGFSQVRAQGGEDSTVDQAFRQHVTSMGRTGGPSAQEIDEFVPSISRRRTGALWPS
jgi:hypothetical protein